MFNWILQSNPSDLICKACDSCWKGGGTEPEPNYTGLYKRDKTVVTVMLFKSLVGSACTLVGAATVLKFGMFTQYLFQRANM